MEISATEFTNEVGNVIHVKASRKEISGVDGINIHIAGPDSDTDVHVTCMEAEVIYEQLGIALEIKEDEALNKIATNRDSDTG